VELGEQKTKERFLSSQETIWGRDGRKKVKRQKEPEKRKTRCCRGRLDSRGKGDCLNPLRESENGSGGPMSTTYSN